MKEPRKKWVVWLIAFCCYLAAVAPRAYDIDHRSIQPDERHWVQRSAELVQNIEEGKFSVLTTHLNQPGIVPAALIGLGQIFTDRYNIARGYKRGDGKFLDHLSSSRLVVALTAALIAPLLLIGARGLVGFWPSFFAAVLISVDPHHIALSRIAHLDAILSLLVTLCLILYIYAERSGSLSTKMLAGFVWGLAIATKPTAAVLVIALMLYKLLLALGVWKNHKPTWKFLHWSDVYAVFLAHVFLCLIYTKLWHTNSSYVWRLKIDCSLAKAIYSFGMYLDSYLWLTTPIGLLGMLGGVTAFYQWKKGIETRNSWFHFRSAGFILGTIVLFLPLFPAVFENLILYWRWTIGLSKEVHQSYGLQWDPPPYGYFGVVFRKVPSAVLILGLTGLFSLIGFMVRGVSRHSLAKLYRGLFPFGVLFVFWMGILGVSSKQDIRYLLPSLPSFYVLAGVGLLVLCKRLVEIDIFRKASHSIFIVGGVTLLASGISTYSWSPHYELYHSSISGGLTRASKANEILPAVGQEAVLNFLDGKASEEGRKFSVMVLGDGSSLKQGYRHYLPNNKKRLNFVAFGSMGNGDYVVVFPSFRKRFHKWEDANPNIKLEKVFAFEEFGVSLVTVYRVPFLDYSERYIIPIKMSPKRTGTHERFSKRGKWVAVGRPGKDRKEVLFHGQYVRVVPGKYRFAAPMGIPQDSLTGKQEIAADVPVVKLEFTSGCYRVVRWHELSSDELKEFVLECDFVKNAKAHLKIYWWGKAPIAIGNPWIVRVSDK
jgi:4-amino-4-deoxy-L-arabinose transferase-like glycosyltransferase